jgi:hypothetical protein
MSDLLSYLQLGLRHILAWGAADHILFIATLAVASEPGRWRQLLVLVTAFTIGHSLTLALATFNVVTPSTRVVETLIPITILITSALNLWRWREQRRVNAPAELAPRLWPRYLMALAFGLIHGLGFSGVLRSLLGGEESLVRPLLAFNVGIEVAQLAVLAAWLLIGALCTWLVFDRRGYVLALSGLTFGGALHMVVSRLQQ